MTLDDLADPDCLPFAYDHLVTGQDLFRVLDQLLRPLLNAVSARRSVITTTSPFTVAIDGGPTVQPHPLPAVSRTVGSAVLVLYVPSADTYYAIANV